ncbi:class I SAM-dependent methyltransferase [Brevibacillus thermoruber]|jgi:16S rRNA (guanine1516-N2)-methyltransferase|uniref:Class I SAM-dependent methyltransferase n=1 Tax=Brevibacillus thermoruber TaxID=33942 RepID=A0A9X3TMY7_9BACL|nr:class I SAM-dependent methyltransferase [Brevibacillus thermoruber]MDA5107274.1 class I SAM-dependent methyltransferase [Brevibacillus thermoruber]
MLITTGLEPSEETRRHAAELAAQFGLPVVERGGSSIEELRRRYGEAEVLIVTAKGARLEAEGKRPFFFHPNTAAFRIKRLERGDTDTMLAACQIHPGDRVLDATLGLGADAIVFAHAVGRTGRVVGIESEKRIAILVADGLRHYPADSEALREAMGRIEVRHGHHLDILKGLPDRSFDVVYFDPMFVRTVHDSTGIAGIREHANMAPLDAEAVEEALRVAKRRVVLKEGKAGRLYERFGFTPFRTRGHQVVYSYKETDGGE